MTGYTSGAKILADIIDDIANELIATAGGYWADRESITIPDVLDAGTGKWTTANKTANNAKRCLVHRKGGITQFITLEHINNPQNFYYGNQNWWYYGKGIRIRTSISWDNATDEPPVDFQSNFLPIESGYNGNGVDMATLQITYFKWVDETGFVIMAKPEPTGNGYQQSVLLCVEHADTVEYSTGTSNFIVFSQGNMWSALYDGNWGPNEWRNRCIIRPGSYQYPNHGSWSNYTFQNAGVSFIPTSSYYAFKSVGNGKVYYVKPIVHNHAGAWNPLFQINLFFPYSEGVGLIDGDVIAIEGDTKKYLCKALSSPDSTARLVYAIRYN
ncbi:MAG: hypothetical protein IBX39_10345 [Candidatus Methanoperedenaceae archaeon]|nr:hypothetical protein [Candidatus Methanoperedenaceae archaeon]